MPKGMDKDVYAVILVGGKGKRLRPLSTNARPKAFLSVTKDRKTMLKVTVERARKIIISENILISGNETHQDLVKFNFPNIDDRNLMMEPVSRNTAPAIGLAAKSAMSRSKDAVLVVIPADQYIPDESRYLNSIRSAVDFARDKDCLVVLGLKPTYPATGFGYIKIKNKTRNRGDIYKVEKFVEKPNVKTAKRLVANGRYLWNAGAFVFRSDAILKALKTFALDIFNPLMQLNKSNIKRLYKRFPNISIDYAVMEKAGNIYCVKGSYKWQDIGSFESLEKVLLKESRKFVVKNRKIVKIL
jgi:mannose-1-phosphate guanylyltransferase